MVLGRLFGGSGPGAGRSGGGSQPSSGGTGGGGAGASPASVGATGGADPDTAALRRIVGQLESLPADQRKFVAGFAYILSRVANADMTILPAEVSLIERTVIEVAQLPEAQSVLVVQIALNHAALYGGTDDYVITREFTRLATLEQRQRLLRCAFTIGAADDTINASESAVLDQVGRELGFTDAEVREVRAEFKESFGAVREVRRALQVEGEPAPGE